MWQLSEAIDGMGDACRALGIPVVGGNVSLYNESRGRDIDPTPIVGLLGLVDRLVRQPPGVRLVDSGQLLLLGSATPQLSGSRWAWERDMRGGSLSSLDLDAHESLCDLVRSLVVGDVVDGVHDVADGGLAVSLAEMAVRSGVGFRAVAVDGILGLYGEGPSRAVVCVDPTRVDEVVRRARDADVPIADLGEAGGDRLIVEGLFDVGLRDAATAWRDVLPTALGAGTTQG